MDGVEVVDWTDGVDGVEVATGDGYYVLVVVVDASDDLNW